MARVRVKLEDLIQDPEEGSFMKFLVFGASGIGKTHLIGTAAVDPRMEPVLVLSFEGGQRVLVGSGCKIIKVDTWDTFNEIYALLEQDDHEFKTVAIDSLSEVHMWALLTVLERTGKKRRNPDLLDLEDYNTAIVQIRRLIRRFRDLPMHFLATATEQEAIDPRTGPVVKPNMVGKMANEIGGLFETVGYYTWGEIPPKRKGGEPSTVRALVLHGDPKSRAKVRAPMGMGGTKDIAEILVDPSMTDVMDELGFTKE